MEGRSGRATGTSVAMMYVYGYFTAPNRLSLWSPDPGWMHGGMDRVAQLSCFPYTNDGVFVSCVARPINLEASHLSQLSLLLSCSSTQINADRKTD
jgi:hypothetical protein